MAAESPSPRRVPLAPLLRVPVERYWPGGPSSRRGDGLRKLSILRSLEKVTGISRRTFCRWQAAGSLPIESADRIAVELGYHPSEIWHDWWDL